MHALNPVPLAARLGAPRLRLRFCLPPSPLPTSRFPPPDFQPTLKAPLTARAKGFSAERSFCNSDSVAWSPRRRNGVHESLFCQLSSDVRSASSFPRRGPFREGNSRRPGRPSDAGGHSQLLRRQLRFFFLKVHPDLTSRFPPEARTHNASALSELNAYLDSLELLLRQPVKGGDEKLQCKIPFEGKTLTFFLPVEDATNAQDEFSSLKKQPVRPAHVHLNALPLEVPRSQVETVVENLCLSLHAAVDGLELGEEVRPPSPEPLLTPKTKQKNAFASLWDQQIEELCFKAALYQPKGEHVDRVLGMRRCLREYKAKLTAKALKTRVSRCALATPSDAAASAWLLADIFKKDVETARLWKRPSEEEAAEVVALKRQSQLQEGGINPNLVFVHSSLAESEREEAFQTLAGLRSASPSSRVLLFSLLEALSKGSPPVPLLVNRQYRLIEEAGMIEVPFDFDAWKFADFLEEHLDKARALRKSVIACFHKPV